MKTLIRRLARGRHAVYGALVQGVLAVLVGLFLQTKNTPNMQLSAVVLIVIGAGAVILAVMALVATYRVSPVVEGEIVALQQPQLPDVRTHMRRTPELTQAA
jgi:asparagine N-glycosylation enzyme membrane subunit Stt3